MDEFHQRLLIILEQGANSFDGIRSKVVHNIVDMHLSKARLAVDAVLRH